VPEVKKQLWGGEFWSDGFFISTVGRNGSEGAIQQYVKNQGIQQDYNAIHKDQLKLPL
jgi:putative transposase